MVEESFSFFAQVVELRNLRNVFEVLERDFEAYTFFKRLNANFDLNDNNNEICKSNLLIRLKIIQPS